MFDTDNGNAQRTGTIRIRPVRGLLDLELRAVWEYRELLYFVIWREIKIRYRQAALGVAWAIIQPIFAVVVFTVIFGHFARFPSDGVPYAVFSFAAILPWTYFAEALQRSSDGLITDSDLVRKVYFPRLIIPLAMVTAPLVDFFFSFLIFLAVLAWYDIPITLNLLFLPPLLLIAMTLGLAVGLLLGPINVRFRDVKHTLPFLVQIWMYASPIVYPLSMVPEEWRWLYSLNPMVGVIEGFRWALLGKEQPDFTAMMISGVVIAMALFLGLIFFKKHERSFADII